MDHRAVFAASLPFVSLTVVLGLPTADELGDWGDDFAERAKELDNRAESDALPYEYRQVWALGDDGRTRTTRAVGVAASTITDGELYVAGTFTDAHIAVPRIIDDLPGESDPLKIELSATGEQQNRTISQAFLMKLSLKGSGAALTAATKGFAWARQTLAPPSFDPSAGNTTASAVAALRDEDGVVLVGMFDRDVAWDAHRKLKNSVKSPSVYIFRINAVGESQWSAQLSNPASGDYFRISCCSVLSERAGEASIVGNFAGSLAATGADGRVVEVKSDLSSTSSPFLLRLTSADGSVKSLSALKLSSSSFVAAAIANHPACLDGWSALAGCADSPTGGRECFIGRRHDEDQTVEVVARWAVGADLSLEVLARSVTLNVVKTAKECMYIVSGIHSNCPESTRANQAMAYMKALRVVNGAMLWEKNITDATALSELPYPLAVAAFPSQGAEQWKIVVSGGGATLATSLGGQSIQRRKTSEGYILSFRTQDGKLLTSQYLYKLQPSTQHLAGLPLALQPARNTNALLMVGAFLGPPPTFWGTAAIGGGGAGGGLSAWMAVVEDTRSALGSELNQSPATPHPEEGEESSNPWLAVITVFAVAAFLLVPLFLCTRRALKPIIIGQAIALREFVSSALPISAAGAGAGQHTSSMRAEHGGLLEEDEGDFSELDDWAVSNPAGGRAPEEESAWQGKQAAASFAIDSEDET